MRAASDNLQLYSLRQSDFKEYQKECAIKADASRLHLLLASNDLKAKLSMDQLRTLVGKMVVRSSECGEFIISVGEVLRDVVVIESGTALVYFSGSPNDEDFDRKQPDEICAELGIVRNERYRTSILARRNQSLDNSAPKRFSIGFGFRKSNDVENAVAAAEMSRRASLFLGVPNARPIQTNNPRRTSNLIGGVGGPVGEHLGDMDPGNEYPPPPSKRISVTRLEIPGQQSNAPQPRPTLNRRISLLGFNSGSPDDIEEKSMQIDPTKGRVACVIEKGCIIGLPILQGNMFQSENKWIPVVDENGEGARSPISVQVTSPSLKYSKFSVATFERLFGKHALKLVSVTKLVML